MNGGPAFPAEGPSAGQFDNPGMTLRDYFAAAALPRCIAFDRNRGHVGSREESARIAYQYADAMLEEREREGAERCEGGAPDCGPVEFHDVEGVPLCKRCWDALAEDSATAVQP